MKTFQFCGTELPGVFRICPFQVGDERGETIKDYSAETFLGNGIDFMPVETLLIGSRQGVLRGLHFQRMERGAKLVRCISGSVWAAVADLRPDSDTFGRWTAAELTGENRGALYVPAYCALGTLALEDTLISCKCGAPFRAEYEDGVRWDDSELGVSWPLASAGELIVSEKDRGLQSFAQYKESVK